jgi:hypothetical protein
MTYYKHKIDGVVIMQLDNFTSKLIIEKTIIGKNYRLIGLQINKNSILMEQLIQNEFSNKQVAIHGDGSIECFGTFKLNHLAAMYYDEDNGTFMDIDNSIELMGRVISGNTTVGYIVRMPDGAEYAYRNSDICEMCTWLRPLNFYVRVNGDQDIIVSARGYDLSRLPIVYADANGKNGVVKKQNYG